MSLTLVLAQGFLRNRQGADSCVANNGICLDWIVHNFDRYVHPFFEHVFLTVVSVGIGFAIALSLGLLAHRRRWLITPFTALTSAIYTVPSISAFLLLLPITGRGQLTAIVALTAYTQVIIFRNVITGLANVPRETVDAAAGMGMTPNQRLFRVEVPLAGPEILAGLRVAAATTVGLAAFAYLAGGGGLGRLIAVGDQIVFKSNVLVAGGLMTLLAAALDLLVLGILRVLSPWRRAVAT
ncbi:MAG: ABC transporter permease [Actinomycetota bacterium]|nr:ABC transporter permease [Actinomycetota bacterium]